MKSHNSRKIYLTPKTAEQVRLSYVSQMEIENFSLDKGSKIIIGFLLASYLIYRNPSFTDEAYEMTFSFLDVDCKIYKCHNIEETIDYNSIGYLVDYIFQHQLANYKNIEYAGNLRKEQGAFYTPFPIADYIVKNTVVLEKKKNFTVLDPACGSGVFLSATALFLSENNFQNRDILNIIHGWDKNGEAIKISKLILAAELGLTKNELLDLMDSNNFVEKDTLLDPVDFYDLFNPTMPQTASFDYIIANPPYDRLKPDKLPEKIKKEVLEYVDILKSSGQYHLSSNGSLELYRLFLERILQLMNLSNGKAGLIIPLSFTNDKSAGPLRKNIVINNKLKKVVFIPERARAFDGVSQAFCLLFLQSDSEDSFETVTSTTSNNLENGTTRKSSLKRIRTAFPKDLNIIDMPDRAYQLVTHLNKFPLINESKEIKNRRGEFDLSFNKDLLGSGIQKLLRGKGLSEYKIKEYDLVDYEGFIRRIKGTTKHNDVLSYRIACQQIANMDSKKRLKFAMVEPETILGNSLNYLNILSASKQHLYGLLAVMNSLLIDWRFRITSSNNHVNNYEIDQLPLPMNTNDIQELGVYIETNFSQLHSQNFRRDLEFKVLDIYDARTFQDVLYSEHPLGDLFGAFNDDSELYKEVMYA